VIISGNKLLVIDPLKSKFHEGGECLDIPLKRLKKNHCPEVTFASILNRFEFKLLLHNANSAIFQLYHGENKLIVEMMMRSALF
jgi:hypothetical protein